MYAKSTKLGSARPSDAASVSAELSALGHKNIEAYRHYVSDDMLAMLGKRSIAEVSRGDYIERLMSLMFVDIRNFTSMSENWAPSQSFSFINEYLSCMEPAIRSYRGVIDKYMGDGILAVFSDSPDDAVRAGIELFKKLEEFNAAQFAEDAAIRIGVGINTGMVSMGVIGGEEHFENTVISDAVNLASRLESATKEYGCPLLISENTLCALEPEHDFHLRFVDRIQVKGKRHPVSVYEVYDIDTPQIFALKEATQDCFEEAVALFYFGQIEAAERLLVSCSADYPQDQLACLYRERCAQVRSGKQQGSLEEFRLVLSWDDSVCIGEKGVDRQHHGLFVCGTRLIDLIKNNAPAEAIGACVTEFQGLFAEHAVYEERLMARSGYPFISFHCQQHRAFSQQFDQLAENLCARLEARRYYTLFQVQILVVDWLINHTCGMDKHLGKYLRMR
jgi:hemerythrin-like metal-binding protein